MPKFEVEITISAAGVIVHVEAESIDEARIKAQKIQVYSGDFSFGGPISSEDFNFDNSFYDAEIEGIWEEEEQVPDPDGNTADQI